jgi:CheY-like chemotaxis protein
MMYSRSMVIFFVDDEVCLLDVYKFIEEELRVTIYTYSDPRKALEEYKLHCPELCFLDYNMPFMNGIELSRHFKSSKNILLTGSVDVPSPETFVKIINKPCDLEVIESFIQEELRTY